MRPEREGHPVATTCTARTGCSRPQVLLLVLLSLLSFGGEASAAPQLVRTQQLLEYDGLPSQEVSALDVASTGHVAFATRAGIGVFDGSHWVRHARDTSFPLSEGVGSLAYDDSGRLWAVGERLNAGIAVLQPEGWEHVPWKWGSGSTMVRDLEVVQLGDERHVAILLHNRQLLVYTKAGGARWVLGEDGERLSDVESISRRGDSLLAVRRSGLLDLELGGEGLAEVIGADLPPGGLVGAEFEGRRLWLLSEDWIGHVEDGVFTLLSDQLGDITQGKRFEYSLCGDGNGGVFFGGALFLMYLGAGESVPERVSSGRMPGAGGVTDLGVDREGGIWLSSLRGVNRFPRHCFESFDARQGLIGDEVTALLELAPGELVVGQVHGVNRFDGAVLSNVALPGTEEPGGERIRVLDLHHGSHGSYWVAGCTLGAMRFWPDGSSELYALEELRQCNSAFEDLDGTVWIAGGTGLFRLDLETGNPERVLLPAPLDVMRTSEPQPLTADKFTARRLYQGPSEALYLTTMMAGIYRWEREGGRLAERPTRFLSEDVPGANSTYSVLELSDGRVVAATRAGLFELVDGRLERSSQARWLDQPCYSLLEDDRGRLWVGTGSGLERWDAGGTGHRHFGLNDGLAGLESNRAAALQDSLGRLWFGTDRGLSRYHEDLDHVKPPLVIASVLKLVEGEVETSEDLDAHSDVEFQFGLVHFDRDEAEVRSRLIGYEEAWSSPRPIAERFVRYTNLPSGEFQLEIQARRGGGPWGPSSFSKEFRVKAPIYLRSWFVALCIAALITLIAGFGTLRGLQRLTSRLSVEIERSGAELEASERRYSDMFTRTSAIQVVLDSRTWCVQLANPAACRYFGLSSEEILGRDFSELTGVPREILVRQGELLLEADREVVLQPADQGVTDKRSVEFRLCRYELHGAQVYQVTIHDISERLLLEERLRESQKLRAVGELASGVAHDFNNLLTAILGFSELALLDAPDNEDVARQVSGIIEAAERGADLVRQLLVYGGRQRLRLDDFDLGPLVEKHADIFRRLFDRRIEVVCQCDPRAGKIHADLGNIARTLMNLGMNARDAMPDGGRLTLRVGRGTWGLHDSSGRSKDYVSMQVEDTGIGMDEETRQRMFEPFFTNKEQGKGTGLGLATVQAVVTQSGGEILVESAPGKGTRIELRFPVAGTRTTSEEPGSASSTARGRRGPGGKLRVLLVDDKDDVREGIAAVLTTLGHLVITAGSGAEALEQLEHDAERSIEVLLTDVLMPGMSGPELAQLVRDRFPGVTALFMTGYDDQRVLLDHEVVLKKPFSASQLVAALEESLQRGSP